MFAGPEASAGHHLAWWTQSLLERKGGTEKMTLARKDGGLVCDGEMFLEKSGGSVLVEQLGGDRKCKRS